MLSFAKASDEGTSIAVISIDTEVIRTQSIERDQDNTMRNFGLTQRDMNKGQLVKITIRNVEIKTPTIRIIATHIFFFTATLLEL